MVLVPYGRFAQEVKADDGTAYFNEFYRNTIALDAAVTKLDSRMRRAADRRRVHRGSRTPTSVAAAANCGQRWVSWRRSASVTVLPVW